MPFIGRIDAIRPRAFNCRILYDHYLIISLQSYLLLLVFHHHSLFHSRLKSFLPQPFPFLLQDSLYGFPRLFTVTSEHIRLFTF